MMKHLAKLLNVLILTSALNASATPLLPAQAAALQRGMAEAERLQRTSEGRAYSRSAQSIFAKCILDCLAESSSFSPKVETDFQLVVFLDADGRVQKLLDNAHMAFGQCFAAKIKKRVFPRPPHSGYAVAFRTAPPRTSR